MVDIADARLVQVLREADRCADVLACMGGEQTEQEVMLLAPQNKVVKKMVCDIYDGSDLYVHGHGTYIVVSIAVVFFFSS